MKRGLHVAYVREVGGKLFATTELECCIFEGEHGKKLGVEGRAIIAGMNNERRRVCDVEKNLYQLQSMGKQKE